MLTGKIMHIVIDGYNLIRQSDQLRSLDRRSLEEGRNALIRFLTPYKKGRRHAITVVFDAWDGGGPLEERDRQAGIDVIYSRRGKKADDVIKEMVSKGRGEETLVVTSDRDVADVLGILERCGAIAETDRIASEYSERALAHLDATGVANPTQDELRQLAVFLIRRAY